MLTTKTSTVVVEEEAAVAGHSLMQLEQVKDSHPRVMPVMTGSGYEMNCSESMESSMEPTKTYLANSVVRILRSHFQSTMCKEIHMLHLREYVG